MSVGPFKPVTHTLGHWTWTWTCSVHKNSKLWCIHQLQFDKMQTHNDSYHMYIIAAKTNLIHIQTRSRTKSSQAKPNQGKPCHPIYYSYVFKTSHIKCFSLSPSVMFYFYDIFWLLLHGKYKMDIVFIKAYAIRICFNGIFYHHKIIRYFKR